MVFENLPHEENPEACYGLNSIMGSDPIYQITSGKIKDMNQTDIYNMFLKSYGKVLSSIFNEGNYGILNIIISNKNILIPFVNVISTANLSITEVRYFSRLTYDYINSKIEKDNDVINILKNSCRNIYRSSINQLIVSVPEALALDLCIARWGSDNDSKNVKRLNSIILNAPDMTTQKIVDIYGTLFNRMTTLFIGTMFDVRDIGNNSYMEDDVNSMISNAILYILDSMNMEDIKKVLSRYSEELKITRKKPRLSLHAIAYDEFSRICDAVKEVELSGKYVY